MSTYLTVLIVCFFVGLFGIITSTELIFKKKILSNDGIMSWEIFRMEYNQLFKKQFLAILDRLLSYPQILIFVYLRLFSSIGLSLSYWLPKSFLALSILIFTICSLTISFRNRVGSDGADQMSLIVSTSLMIGIIPGNDLCLKYSLYFIAFQCILSYTTSGISKLFSKEWRSGIGLKYIISTQAYGHKWLENQMNNSKQMSFILSWGTILFLTSFFLFFIIGGYFLISAFILGAAFHLSNGIFMKLHTFIWSFLATYPAIYFARLDLENIFN